MTIEVDDVQDLYRRLWRLLFEGVDEADFPRLVAGARRKTKDGLQKLVLLK
jgi:hypothetical protein